MPCDRISSLSSTRETRSRGNRCRTSTPKDDEPANPPQLYVGYIESILDVFVLIEACHRDLAPRIVKKHTVSEKEHMVQSGAIIIWEEKECGFQRWTDPYAIQLHLDSNTGTADKADIGSGAGEFKTSDSDVVRDMPKELKRFAGGFEEGRKCRAGPRMHRWCVPGGLVKRTITIPFGTNKKWHIRNYYHIDDILRGRLKRPSRDPALIPLIPEISQCLLSLKFTKTVLNVKVDSTTGKLQYVSDWRAGHEEEFYNGVGTAEATENDESPNEPPPTGTSSFEDVKTQHSFQVPASFPPPHHPDISHRSHNMDSAPSNPHPSRQPYVTNQADLDRSVSPQTTDTSSATSPSSPSWSPDLQTAQSSSASSFASMPPLAVPRSSPGTSSSLLTSYSYENGANPPLFSMGPDTYSKSSLPASDQCTTGFAATSNTPSANEFPSYFPYCEEAAVAVNSSYEGGWNVPSALAHPHSTQSSSGSSFASSPSSAYSPGFIYGSPNFSHQFLVAAPVESTTLPPYNMEPSHWMESSQPYDILGLGDVYHGWGVA